MDAGGTFLGHFAVTVGLVAGMIAVGGFLGHVRPALARRREDEMRRMTAIGGLVGLSGAVGIVVLSVFIG
jgi:hypothetical protein